MKTKIIDANKLVDNLVDEMHRIFTQNQDEETTFIVDDFIANKRQEYLVEEVRSKK